MTGPSARTGNSTHGYHGILARLPNERRSRWLGSGFASVTRLRIHAGMATAERAEQVAAELRDMNPGVTFTVKPVLKEG